MDRRYGDSASIVYHDVTGDGVKTKHSLVLGEIDKSGLLYPVTVIDGTPVYDGAVSYPAILRAVENKLAQSVTAD